MPSYEPYSCHYLLVSLTQRFAPECKCIAPTEIATEHLVYDGISGNWLCQRNEASSLYLVQANIRAYSMSTKAGPFRSHM